MAKSRKRSLSASKSGSKSPSKSQTPKKAKGNGKGTKWTRFVQKIYKEMKAKNPNVKLGAAMKEASKRKSEM